MKKKRLRILWYRPRVSKAIPFKKNYKGKPKGIIRISNDIDPEKLKAFQEAWKEQMSGVMNAHKIPILSGPIEMIYTNKRAVNRRSK